MAKADHYPDIAPGMRGCQFDRKEAGVEKS